MIPACLKLHPSGQLWGCLHFKSLRSGVFVCDNRKEREVCRVGIELMVTRYESSNIICFATLFSSRFLGLLLQFPAVTFLFSAQANQVSAAKCPRNYCVFYKKNKIKYCFKCNSTTIAPSLHASEAAIIQRLYRLSLE